MTRTISRKEGNACKRLLKNIHSDVTGPFSAQSIAGNAFIDEYLRYAVVMFVKHKSENSLPESKILDYLQKGLIYSDSTLAESTKKIFDKVLKATTQSRSGFSSKNKSTVSNCPKTSDMKECVKLEGSPSILCKFEIWENSLLNFIETSVKIGQSRCLDPKGKLVAGNGQKVLVGNFY
ncbi:unnamed protein product [Ceutorhynchus assimilis]|uniref:Uncharacterized protein n=1 Tax=Ceutorhynchus assimilis TaxID=467358 RepID=A0A9N9QNB0_9CUCU|nr:unnamed protein product [Ceutorhynchus assimilis]